MNTIFPRTLSFPIQAAAPGQRGIPAFGTSVVGVDAREEETITGYDSDRLALARQDLMVIVTAIVESPIAASSPWPLAISASDFRFAALQINWQSAIANRQLN